MQLDDFMSNAEIRQRDRERVYWAMRLRPTPHLSKIDRVIDHDRAFVEAHRVHGLALKRLDDEIEHTKNELFSLQHPEAAALVAKWNAQVASAKNQQADEGMNEARWLAHMQAMEK